MTGAAGTRHADPRPHALAGGTDTARARLIQAAGGQVLPVPDQAGPSRQTGTGEPARSRPGPDRDRSLRSWPLLILALPAAVAVWSGWVGIGQLTGFGEVHPLPGLWDSLHLNTAVTLPVGVEAYAAYALRAWLSPSTVFHRDQAVRPLVRDRVPGPGHGRASRLPPAHPGPRRACTVGHHHRSLLPPSTGPRHGRRPGPHDPRGRLQPGPARPDHPTWPRTGGRSPGPERCTGSPGRRHNPSRQGRRSSHHRGPPCCRRTPDIPPLTTERGPARVQRRPRHAGPADPGTNAQQARTPGHRGPAAGGHKTETDGQSATPAGNIGNPSKETRWPPLSQCPVASKIGCK